MRVYAFFRPVVTWVPLETGDVITSSPFLRPRSYSDRIACGVTVGATPCRDAGANGAGDAESRWAQAKGAPSGSGVATPSKKGPAYGRHQRSSSSLEGDWSGVVERFGQPINTSCDVRNLSSGVCLVSVLLSVLFSVLFLFSGFVFGLVFRFGFVFGIVFGFRFRFSFSVFGFVFGHCFVEDS